jgi:SOS-response transcriptional repressor LexA
MTKARKEQQFVVRELPYEGEVGAGRLLAFTPKGGVIPVVVPADIPESELATMKINGGSLERVGIYNGDFVVVRKIWNKRAIKKDTVCIVWAESYNDLMAKKIQFKDDYLILHYCGLEPEPPLYLPAEDCEIRGIVIGTSRQRTEWPFIEYPEDLPVKEAANKRKTAPDRKAKVIEAIEKFRKPEPEEPF